MENKVSTADRLKELMEKYGYTQADIVSRCQPFCEKYGVKIGRNTISQYVSGKVLPKQNTLTILALALNTNEVWLMGYDVDSGIVSSNNNVSVSQKEFLDKFESLCESDRNIVSNLVDSLYGKK